MIGLQNKLFQIGTFLMAPVLGWNLWQSYQSQNIPETLVFSIILIGLTYWVLHPSNIFLIKQLIIKEDGFYFKKLLMFRWADIEKITFKKHPKMNLEMRITNKDQQLTRLEILFFDLQMDITKDNYQIFIDEIEKTAKKVNPAIEFKVAKSIWYTS